MGSRTASVAIVTVNYNGAPFIRPFLSSVAKLRYPNRSLIVVDCGSSDGSPDQVALQAPEARLIRLGENRGITGGNDAGIRAALADGCDYVLFLNPDTVVDPGLLDALVAVASPERMTAPCVLLAGSDGLLDDTVGDFDWRRGVWREWRYGKPRAGSAERARRVSMASLTCLLVPAGALRALAGDRGPYMDARYFMYYDDFDAVRRLRMLGYDLVYTPEGAVYHRKSATGGGVDSPFKHYYATRNRLLLMRSVWSTPAFCGFFLYFAGGRILRVAQALARGQAGAAWAIVRGVVDFLAGRTGRTLLPDAGPHGLDAHPS